MPTSSPIANADAAARVHRHRAGLTRTAANTASAVSVAEEVNAVALLAFFALIGIALWATGHLIVR